MGVAKRVRGERLFGYVGLGLFCLFPLVSVLQLRDPDAVWRSAADRTRNSVVALYDVADEASTAFGCGIVIQDRPLRVITSATAGEALSSPHAGGWIRWNRIHIDPEGRFALFEAADRTAAPASSTARSPKPMPRLGASSVQRVDAALVPPEALAQEPLWVGTLRPESQPPTYRATELRRVLGRGAAATEPAEIDAGLLGAPFVSREGAVVAVLTNRDARGPVAIPIETIAAALRALEPPGARRPERMP